jgi:hypothetical protein
MTGPPAPFRQTSAATLELRQSGGWMALFGLPFFLGGVFVALGITGIVPMEPKPGGLRHQLFLLAISLVFLTVGSVLMFGRRWLTIDLGRGTVVREVGLLVPLKRNERLLQEFNAVLLAFEAGDSDSPDRYPVRLRAPAGNNFDVTKPQQFAEARKQAEYLSSFLKLPLADVTTDHETLVSPEHAGDALGERLRSMDGESARPDRPPQMFSQVTESPGSTRIEIGGPKFPLSGVLGIILPAIVLLVAIPVIVRFFFREGPGALPAFMILMLILGIPSIAAGLNLMVHGSRRRTTVSASPSGLVIEQRGGRRARTIEVSAADILDVDMSTIEAVLNSRRASTGMPGREPNSRIANALRSWIPSKGIVVKSRQELITFGEGLSAVELRYLTWVLRKALARR